MSALLHSKTATQLQALRQRPAGSVIFHGARGLGKATVARELAAELKCPVADFVWIDSGDKSSIGIEQIRNLSSELALRPFAPDVTRVVVIDEAQRLTLEAQNALLKLLEEPPARTLIILITDQLQSLLVTVRSRCRAVQFVRPSESDVAALLVSKYGLTGPAAASLAAASGAAPGVAISLAQDSATAEALETLTANSLKVQNQSLFDRLLLAGRLATSGADLERFAAALHRRLVLSLERQQAEPGDVTSRLDALETFRQHLAAKVAPKVALERLMLELG